MGILVLFESNNFRISSNSQDYVPFEYAINFTIHMYTVDNHKCLKNYREYYINMCISDSSLTIRKLTETRPKNDEENKSCERNMKVKPNLSYMDKIKSKKFPLQERFLYFLALLFFTGDLPFVLLDVFAFFDLGSSSSSSSAPSSPSSSSIISSSISSISSYSSMGPPIK